MKIILVATGAKGRNVVFVSDTLRAYSLDEAVQLAKEGELEGIYVVQKKNSVYLRSRRSVSARKQLEPISITARQLFRFANDAGSTFSQVALNQYLQLYERALKLKQDKAFIVIDFFTGISQNQARKELQSHQELIFAGAKRFRVDPYLLGAIIIDELARFFPFEEIFEKLALFYVGKDVSAGIAQVKIETARGLIQDGYYNPNPDDPKLSLDKIKTTSRMDLYEYVRQSKYNVFFAAAHMRALIDHWKKFADLEKRPEIIATLYSIGRGKSARGNPQPSKRGSRIAGEFYAFAKEWL